jgi:hypothetical protein
VRDATGFILNMFGSKMQRSRVKEVEILAKQRRPDRSLDEERRWLLGQVESEQCRSYSGASMDGRVVSVLVVDKMSRRECVRKQKTSGRPR